MELDDWKYLLMALNSGGATDVKCPAVRTSLKKLGFMTVVKVRANYAGSQIMPHGMALTKKGQKRALEIKKQIDEDRLLRIKCLHRRGISGAAFPKIISKGDKNV
jgi:hypothetical protein